MKCKQVRINQYEEGYSEEENGNYVLEKTGRVLKMCVFSSVECVEIHQYVSINDWQTKQIRKRTFAVIIIKFNHVYAKEQYDEL